VIHLKQRAPARLPIVVSYDTDNFGCHFQPSKDRVDTIIGRKFQPVSMLLAMACRVICMLYLGVRLRCCTLVESCTTGDETRYTLLHPAEALSFLYQYNSKLHHCMSTTLLARPFARDAVTDLVVSVTSRRLASARNDRALTCNIHSKNSKEHLSLQAAFHYER
jgi:hypothetical protein